MEITNIIRNELKLSTPIIVLTASGIEKTELDAFTIGSNEFVSEPFSSSILKAKIEKPISKI